MGGSRWHRICLAVRTKVSASLSRRRAGLLRPVRTSEDAQCICSLMVFQTNHRSSGSRLCTWLASQLCGSFNRRDLFTSFALIWIFSGVRLLMLLTNFPHLVHLNGLNADCFSFPFDRQLVLEDRPPLALDRPEAVGC